MPHKFESHISDSSPVAGVVLTLNYQNKSLRGNRAPVSPPGGKSKNAPLPQHQFPLRFICFSRRSWCVCRKNLNRSQQEQRHFRLKVKAPALAAKIYHSWLKAIFSFKILVNFFCFSFNVRWVASERVSVCLHIHI